MSRIYKEGPPFSQQGLWFLQNLWLLRYIPNQMRFFMRGYLFFALALSAVAFGTEVQKKKSAADGIRVLPVKRTPEAEASTVVVSLPKNGAVMKGNPVFVQLRILGYPLGAASQFDRADEIAVSDRGQSVHVVVDNMPYFPVSEQALDPFNEQGWYAETSYKFEIPKRLSSGEHVLRVFLARSFGESLKGENTFAASTFFLGTEKQSTAFDLSKPYITYNEPSGNMDLTESMPVLLDFFVSNCELTSDGYKVRLIVDGTAIRTLTSWQPYYIYGLKRGKHTVRLELLGPSGTVLPGIFNDAERSFTID